MKMTNTAVTIVCVLVSILVTSGDAYNLKSWMADVSNDKRLCEIAIPGTHDSGAYGEHDYIGKCQDWSISQQLDNGIRFLDIRIADKIADLFIKKDFEVKHGLSLLGSFKEKVMAPVKRFLTSNPSETILMRIKQEHGPLDVPRLERDFIKNSDYKFICSGVNSQTKLSHVRGQVVLFHDYNDATVGMDWYNGETLDMNIQDEFTLKGECKKNIFNKRVCSELNGLDYPRKARQTVAWFPKAAQHFGDRFYVSFASAQWGNLYQSNNAAVSNKAVKNYFASHPNTPVGCIIPMDFPGRVGGVVDAIINNNFKGIDRINILSSSQTEGFWGEWGEPRFCPSNQFVFRYRLRIQSDQGPWVDDTGLNDIELGCAQKGHTGSYTNIWSKFKSWGDMSSYMYCGGDNPVIGFDLKIQPKQGILDDTAANDIDLYCKKGQMISAGTGKWGSWSPVLKCPSGQAVAGIATRVQSTQTIFGDNTALNGVRLYCKKY